MLGIVAAAVPDASRQEEIEVQSIGSSNLTETLLISHLIRSIIGRGLILQIQRSGSGARGLRRVALEPGVSLHCVAYANRRQRGKTCAR